MAATQEQLDVLVGAYRRIYKRDPYPLPVHFNVLVASEKAPASRLPPMNYQDLAPTVSSLQISVFDEAPPWLERYRAGDVDLRVSEKISLCPSSDGAGVHWKLQGDAEPSLVSEFFAGVVEVSQGIEVDVWVNSKLRCVLGHQLKSGELLIFHASVPLLYQLIGCGHVCVLGIKRLNFWLENSCVYSADDTRGGFDRGVFYREIERGGWVREVVFDANKFV